MTEEEIRLRLLVTTRPTKTNFFVVWYRFLTRTSSPTTNASTLKALVSAILTFGIVMVIGAFTSALGQDTAPPATAPAANPCENVEADAATGVHNHPGQPASSPAVALHTP